MVHAKFDTATAESHSTDLLWLRSADLDELGGCIKGVRTLFSLRKKSPDPFYGACCGDRFIAAYTSKFPIYCCYTVAPVRYRCGSIVISAAVVKISRVLSCFTSSNERVL